MIKTTALSLALLTAVGFADVRTPVFIPDGGVLASAGDHAVVLSRSSSSDGLSLLRSDGRALTWSAPQFVVPPGTAGAIAFEDVKIVGDQAYVFWADDRFDAGLPFGVASTPFLRVFDLASGTVGPEIQIPTSSTPQNSGAGEYDYAAVVVGGAVHLHVASRRTVLDPITGLSHAEIVLASSLDNGATWLTPQVVTSVTPSWQLYAKVRVVADGNQVHVLFGDTQGTFDPVLFDQRSVDGGVSLDFPQPKPVPGALEAYSFEADLEGSLLAIAFENGGSFVESFVATSTDGGVTYNKLAPFKTPVTAPTLAHSFEPRVVILDGSQDIVAGTYGQDPGAFTEVVAFIHSPDGGKTWPDSSVPYALPGPSVTGLRLEASGAGRDRVVAIWELKALGAGNLLEAATSFDRGADFGLSFALSTTKVSGVQLAWNDVYQNVIVSSFDSGAAQVGGWRPQSITPTGFTGGSTSIGASFENFDGGADLAWLFLSTTTTSLPLGDGRELGIGVSPLFTSLLPLALGGSFAAAIDPLGSGALHPFAVPAPGVPAGLQLFAVGLSFDSLQGKLVDISDVVELGT
jgi:hypothetical protein